jgi:tetratricopeptide (TPR) repeat protein
MPTHAELFALARQHQQAGDLDAAERVYRQILQHDAIDARAWLGLGTLLQGRNRLGEAAECFRRALRVHPEDPETHRRLGDALLPQGLLGEAAAAYQNCLRLQPDNAEALTNLGVALGGQGKPDEALACYRRALRLRPDAAEVHHNLGNVLREQGKLDEAVACFRQALALRPDYAKAHHHLGLALVVLNRAEEAVASQRRALELRPDYPEALNGLGGALSVQGRVDEAVASYEQALRLWPDYPEAHWNLGLALLLRGDFERGWSEAEWIWKCKNPSPLAAFRQPLWDGSPLHGRTVLLHAQQGLGDTLQLVRYAPLVKARGGVVVVQCQAALTRLLRGSGGIDRLVTKGEPIPEHAVHLALQSLPRVFKTTLASIPAEIPYLFVDPALVERWREALRPLTGFRVGIAWQGDFKHGWDRHRSIPLGHFAPLAEVEGVRLISLQKGPGAEQLRTVAGCFPVTVLDRLDEDSGPFMDTAAVLKGLDLVICCDTALAHLAGALGVPVWVALPAAPDWRWLLGREDSPWYPTMRLFRQTAPDDWRSVFARMTGELRRLTTARPGPVAVTVSVGELLDRIARLEIEGERAADGDEAAAARAALAALAEVRDRRVGRTAESERLAAELKEVHAALWEVEEGLRRCEREGDFGAEFIELARSARRQDERRQALMQMLDGAPGGGEG